MRDANPGHELSSPSQLGYRWPAEWETHSGTWLTWPHNPATWPGSLADVERFYEELIRAIAADETVYVNVQDDAVHRHVEARLQARDVRGDVRFLQITTNDAWCRDYGPTVLIHDFGNLQLPPRLAVNWEYNAWGGKYPPFDADNAAALQMATALKIPVVAGGIVAEGGALDANGAGLLMTTASCLLNSNRNPGASRADRRTTARNAGSARGTLVGWRIAGRRYGWSHRQSGTLRGRQDRAVRRIAARRRRHPRARCKPQPPGKLARPPRRTAASGWPAVAGTVRRRRSAIARQLCQFLRDKSIRARAAIWVSPGCAGLRNPGRLFS